LVREKVAKAYDISDEKCFSDYKEMIHYMEKHGRIDAEAVMICVQDAMHTEVALAFAKYKYHMLLEKPMAISAQDCKLIVQAVEEQGIMFAVCHVLRYSFLTQRVKQLLDKENAVGQIMHVQHLEPVGWFHFAHSYVRGNWRNENTSTFMLLAKACHDMDWLMYIMNNQPVVRLSSVGSLVHFKKENKPVGASDRCLTCPEGIERACPYSAKKIYLDAHVKTGHTGWPVNIIVADGSVPDIENITDALTKSSYGKCVYESDNNVADNHVVMLEFDTGATATLTVIAHSNEICQRKTRIFGTHGELDIDGHKIRHCNFSNGKITHYDIDMEMKEHIEGTLGKMTTLTGHGCADYYLMKVLCCSKICLQIFLVLY
jgi:predicted dehydrogenase